jgi:hypothetical protein
MIEAVAHTIKQIENVDRRRSFALVWAGTFLGDLGKKFRVNDFLIQCGVPALPENETDLSPITVRC